MPWPNTLGRPDACACTSSVCIGLKSPDAPAYWTRSVRVSVCENSGASSPSETSSKNTFCSVIGPVSYLSLTRTSTPVRRDRSGILGEAEDSFTDDVALDLARAAGDRQAAGEQELLGPGRRRPVDRRTLAREQTEADLLHLLVVLDPEQLLDRRLRAGRVRARERRERQPEAQHRERIPARHQLAHLREHRGVVFALAGPHDVEDAAD